MCQHLQVVMNDSAAKPIDIFSVHSPASMKHPLTPTVHEHFLHWFATNAGSRALIGGDLNSSRPRLDAGFKNHRDIHYCNEPNHLHGDLVIAKGLDADSMECDVQSTSIARKMCVVIVQVEVAASAGKRAKTSSSEMQ